MLNPLPSAPTPLPYEWPPFQVDAKAVELKHPFFERIRRFERGMVQHVQPMANHTRPRYLFVRDVNTGGSYTRIWRTYPTEHWCFIHSSRRARAFIFWRSYPTLSVNADHPPFPDVLPSGERHRIHIPLNALIAGPAAGGPLFADASDDPSRRAISLEYFDAVLPPTERAEIDCGATNRELGLDDTRPGDERMQRWAKKLREMGDSCVVVTGGSPFPWWFLGSWEVLSIWPEYYTGPTLREFAWSPLATEAIYGNFNLIMPSSSVPAYLCPTPDGSAAPRSFNAFLPLRAESPVLPGLLAIHVRRGDFNGHSQSLAEYKSEFTTFTKLGTPGLCLPERTNGGYGAGENWIASGIPDGYEYPAIPSYFDVPEGLSRREASLKHSWPTMEEIVVRAREIRVGAREARWGLSSAQTLRAVYISTDGEAEWVGELATALRADGWAHVASSLDIFEGLSREAQAVSQVVDQGIMTIAEQFVGNGFSSLTGNVVQVRLGGGREPGTIHYW
ncbi:SH3 and PX-domain-containing 3 [Mycena kentingensis (nom. inval.)]|nr:SH3 and PX-domain-containing 3 [Mycena kentingensis (nom. inval.)]